MLWLLLPQQKLLTMAVNWGQIQTLWDFHPLCLCYGGLILLTFLLRQISHSRLIPRACTGIRKTEHSSSSKHSTPPDPPAAPASTSPQYTLRHSWTGLIMLFVALPQLVLKFFFLEKNGQSYLYILLSSSSLSKPGFDFIIGSSCNLKHVNALENNIIKYQ